MKILVAVDGSKYTRRMLNYLAAHDALWNPAHHYTVLHCSAALIPRAAAYADRETLTIYYHDQSEKVLKPTRAYFEKAGLHASFEARVGDPAEVIAEFAERGRFDLLLMGSHGHGSISNLVIGSVTTEVLARCSKPVLIVR